MEESDSPRSTIRRTTALVAASLLLVVVAGVPAWAGASITPAEIPADADQQLRMAVTEPTDEEAEAYGDTARVHVTAPKDFTILTCDSAPVGWNCTRAEDGRSVTFTKSQLALGVESDAFVFTVHTSPINGQHAFRVTQSDGPPPAEGEEPPATVTSRPAVTVTGGEDPEPETKPTPTPSPTAGDGGGANDGSKTDGGGGSSDGGDTDDGATQTGDDDASASDEADQSAAAGDTGTSDSGSTGDSTAPRRTQGRASGTTLQITPGEPMNDDPAVAPPAVADDPAVAPPSGTDGTNGVDRDTSDSAAAAGTGARPSDQPGGGAPWQQWVGGAMLLAGLATVGVRWLRERRAS